MTCFIILDKFYNCSQKNFENYFISFFMFLTIFDFLEILCHCLQLWTILTYFVVVDKIRQNVDNFLWIFCDFFFYNFTIATSGQQSKFICIVFIFKFGTESINTSKLFNWWLVGRWITTIGVGALCLRFSFLYFQMKSKQNGTWQSLFLIYLKKKWNFWNPVAKFDK